MVLQVQMRFFQAIAVLAMCLNTTVLNADGTLARRSLTHHGDVRVYDIFVPSSLESRSGRRPAVLLMFHGGGSNAEGIRITAGIENKAAREGFLVVYPHGTGPTVLGKHVATWNAGRCCGQAQERNIDDVGFVKKIVEEVVAHYGADARRIYATGLSNGALFSYRLACELSGYIAAIAPIGAQDAEISCSPERPVPIIHFHGMLDRAAHYDGSRCGGKIGKEWDCRSVPDYVGLWARRNGCREVRETYFQVGAARCERFLGCKPGARVALCTIADGGHTWPGGTYGLAGPLLQKTLGKISTDVSANDMMWDFFSDTQGADTDLATIPAAQIESGF